MESEEEGQWSWWQEDSMDVPPTAPMRAAVLADPALDEVDAGSEIEPNTPAAPENDPVRMALIGLVAVLSVTLAGVSYARFADGGSVSDAAGAVVTASTAPTTTVADVGLTTTSAAPSSTTTSTTAPPTTTTTLTQSSTTTALPASEPPTPPQDVTVVSTSNTGAEIRWRSEECVGSRYRVGQFEEGGGGFPEIQRCWFNHVILAGDPAFSPPLSPNTSYSVMIQAVARDGTTSEPVVIEFTTTS
ncbi:MAG: fibronectin type III domain-containing protein [Acidimicrobiales bacterium]